MQSGQGYLAGTRGGKPRQRFPSDCWKTPDCGVASKSSNSRVFLATRRPWTFLAPCPRRFLNNQPNQSLSSVWGRPRSRVPSFCARRVMPGTV